MKNFSPQIHWGKEHEERACKYYNENRKDAVELMEVLPFGLHLMPEKAYLGASTDGIIVIRFTWGLIGLAVTTMIMFETTKHLLDK